MSKTVSKTSTYETVLEAFFVPPLILMPLSLYKEILDQTVRDNSLKWTLIILLTAVSTLALTLPFLLNRKFRDPNRPIARVLLMYIAGSLAYSTYYVIFRSFESFRLPQQTMMQITVSFILILFFISSFMKGRLEIRRTPFHLPILLITLVSLYSFILTPSFMITLKDFTQYVFVILNFYLIIHCLDAKKHFNALVGVFIIVMAIEAALGVVQHFGINKLIGLGNNIDPFSTLGNKNYVAEMLAMTIPLGLAYSISARRWWLKALCWAGIAPMLFVVLISVTRGSWMGLLPALVVFFLYSLDGLSHKKAVEAVAHLAGLAALAILIMFLSSHKIIFKPPDYSYASRFMSIIDIVGGVLARSPKMWIPYAMVFIGIAVGINFMLRRPRAKQIAVASAAIAVFVITFLAVSQKNQSPLNSPVPQTQTQAAPPQKIEDSIVSRRFIWGGTKEMIRHYPFGVGMGAYKIRYLSMLKAYLAGSKQTTIPGFFKDVNAKEAHNEYLHVWAEEGPLGPLFILFFIIVVVRFFYRVYYKLGDDEHTKIIMLGAFSGLVSIGASAFFGFPFHIVGTSMFCGVFVALLVFSEDRLRGAGALELDLPGFKPPRQPVATKTKSKQQKKKKAQSQQPAPVDDSWKKHWIVLSLSPELGVLLLFVSTVFFIVVSFWSYQVQMSNIIMKKANYIAESADTVPANSPTIQEIYNTALEVYDDALMRDPYNGDIHLFRGMFFQKLKQSDNALNEFLEAQRYFDLPQISLNLGAIYFEKGPKYFDEAERQFRDSLAVYPNYPLPRYNLGLIFYQKALMLLDSKQKSAGTIMKSKDGRYEVEGLSSQEKAKQLLLEAAKMFTEAIRINPTLDSASFKLALTYERLKDYDKALYWYQYTMRVNPGNNDAYYNYGLVLTRKASMLNEMADKAMKEGRTEEARALYASATALQKNSSDNFARSVANDPNNVKAMNNLGNMYFNEGKFDMALAMYKKALSADPDYLNALMNISLAYIQLRQYDNAMVYLNQLTRRRLAPPHEMKAVFMIATCDMGGNRPADAEAILEATISKYGSSQYNSTAEYISVVLRYAELMNATRRPAEAVAKLEQIANVPMAAYQESEVLYRLGVAAANSGQIQKAKTAFGAVVSRFPQSPFSAESKNNLDKLNAFGK